MEIAIYSSVFGVASLLGWILFPAVERRSEAYVNKNVEQANLQLEDMFIASSTARLKLLYLIAPPIAALMAWSLTGQPYAMAVGVALGLIGPNIWIRYLKKNRYSRFHNMLVDTLLLISSCLRAGLSMLQSFTVVAEEMPAPASQEIGLVLKEIRMGVSLEDAMVHFRKRMPSDEVNLFVTAVLVARETGGDVTLIFAKLVETLRERKKIKEKILTLTFMAKAQGVVMGCLPIFFLFVVYRIDPRHIQFFFHDPVGQLVFGGVCIVQLVVLVMMLHFSKSPM